MYGILMAMIKLSHTDLALVGVLMAFHVTLYGLECTSQTSVIAGYFYEAIKGQAEFPQ